MSAFTTCCGSEESVTVTGIVYVPRLSGVPKRVEELKVIPGGSDPFTVRLYGVVPPLMNTVLA
jgi:hypothetical protein